MEKILLLINANKPHLDSIDFACYLADLTGSDLTGLFIENIYFSQIPPGGVDNSAYFSSVAEVMSDTVTTDTEQSVRLFQEKCRKAEIMPEVYIDKGEPIQETLFESRFADLLIVDPMISFYGRKEEMPSHFIKEILRKSECPVLLAPHKFEKLEQLIFCYDGNTSSVYAIKQFTKLLPQLSNKKVLLLEVKKSSKQEFDEGDRRMMDWLHAHYASVSYHSLTGDADDELFSFLFMKQNALVVMGAYGQTPMIRLFRKSTSDILIRNIDLPLFISHN